jgi:hypothetical protein
MTTCDQRAIAGSRQQRSKTTSFSSEDRLGVDPIDQRYHRRLFGWAGEVLRMPKGNDHKKFDLECGQR